MAQDYTLCVGTVGGGLSCSPDGDDLEPYQEPHPLGMQCSSPGSVPR